MTYYQVEVMKYDKWRLVKGFRKIAGHLFIRVDPSERLTRQQAMGRLNRLSAQHGRRFSFRLSEVSE